jgi:hypothetical protein
MSDFGDVVDQVELNFTENSLQKLLVSQKYLLKIWTSLSGTL